MRATIVLHTCLPFLRVQQVEARQLVDAGLGVQYQGQVVVDMRRRGWSVPDLEPHTRARVLITERV
jgi:hypothetical protein